MYTPKKAARPLFLLFCLAVLTALAACTQPMQSPSPPATMKIGVASFTQPKSVTDMMAGYMSENVQHIDQSILPELDDLFVAELSQNSQRAYAFSKQSGGCQGPRNNQTSKQSALKYWSEVGLCMNVDVLLVPQILEWHERDGGEMGVTSPAAVTMDFFLIDVKNQRLISRSRYEEVQQDLASNLLNTKKFFERDGKWVRASELAQYGMRKAIKDFML